MGWRRPLALLLYYLAFLTVQGPSWSYHYIKYNYNEFWLTWHDHHSCGCMIFAAALTLYLWDYSAEGDL